MSKAKDKLLLEVYKDLAQPSVWEIGKILQGITKVGRFAFAGFDYLAMKQDRWQKFLEIIGTKVDEENLIDAQPQIVGPIIESMVYTDVESLIGEMFAELLARSIDKTNQDKAHPAFPQIIRQLSHDEAVILFLLKKKVYKVDQKWDLIGNRSENMKTIKEEFPLDKLNYPDNLWIYMEHLNNLALAGTWKTQNDIPLYDNKSYTEGSGALQVSYPSGKQTGGIVKSERRLTDFGRLFANACVPDDYKVESQP